MEKQELVEFLDSYLKLDDFMGDISSNGLQVDFTRPEVRRIAVAVDACQKTIDDTISGGYDMLVVHHGFFWGKPLKLVGNHYRRIKALMDADVGLYAAHLPLDAHPCVGNNATMARMLGMKDFDMAFPFRGMECGLYGELPHDMDIDEINEKLGFENPFTLPFGKKRIRTVGIVSGGGAWDVFEAMDRNLDCFITGECAHEIFNDVKESGMNMICAGHYNTEVFGVQSLAKLLAQKFNLEWHFIDNKTNL